MGSSRREEIDEDEDEDEELGEEESKLLEHLLQYNPSLSLYDSSPIHEQYQQQQQQQQQSSRARQNQNNAHLNNQGSSKPVLSPSSLTRTGPSGLAVSESASRGSDSIETPKPVVPVVMEREISVNDSNIINPPVPSSLSIRGGGALGGSVSFSSMVKERDVSLGSSEKVKESESPVVAEPVSNSKPMSRFKARRMGLR